MSRYLLTEDVHLAQLLYLWLLEDGLAPLLPSAPELLAAAPGAGDLVLLDCRLPGGLAGQVLQQLAVRRGQSPCVLLLCPPHEEQALGPLLAQGCRDLLLLPPRKAALLARVRALLARPERGTGPPAAAAAPPAVAAEPVSEGAATAPYELDLARQLIRVHGEAVELTQKEFELAAYLFQRPEELHPRARLLKAIWGKGEGLNTRTVDTHISRLRSKLRLEPAQGWRLVSLYNRGYRLERAP